MTNKEILNIIKKNPSDIDIFKTNIDQWDLSKGKVKVKDITKVIRFDLWTKKDFNYNNERRIAKYLPDYMLDIFFEMKELKKQPYLILNSFQMAYARLQNYPMNEENEKSYCAYMYFYDMYVNNSKIKKGVIKK